MESVCKMYYTNSKGRNVEVRATKHAIERFGERYAILFGRNTKDPERDMWKRFSMASQVSGCSKQQQRRLRRYGSDTLYFRHSEFTFVVQNATIVTVEISAKNKRHLNKVREK